MSAADAIASGDVERALFECGSLMVAGATDSLENAWIECMSRIGESLSGDDQATLAMWCELLHDTLAILANERLSVREAFLLTTKLSLLMNRMKHNGSGTSIRRHVASMRDRIVSEIPEGAQLSDAGLAMFRQILPANDATAERAFTERILAGLCRLWSVGDIGVAREAIEYLTRKKFVLPVASLDGWPAPSREEALKGDLVWMLWGAMMLFKKCPIIDAAWRVFSWECRGTKMRNCRLGLLWGCTWVMRHSPGQSSKTWSTNEMLILNRVASATPAFWKQLGGKGEDQKAGAMADGLQEFFTFMPRNTAATADTADISTNEYSNSNGIGDQTYNTHSGIRGVVTREEEPAIQNCTRTTSDPQPVDQHVSFHPKEGIRMESRHGLRYRTRSTNKKNHRIERI